MLRTASAVAGALGPQPHSELVSDVNDQARNVNFDESLPPTKRPPLPSSRGAWIHPHRNHFDALNAKAALAGERLR